MTLPRELTEEECGLICKGLAKEKYSIETALRQEFESSLKDRVNRFTEIRLDKLKTIDNLYKLIACNTITASIPKGELIKQDDGSFKRQE